MSIYVIFYIIHNIFILYTIYIHIFNKQFDEAVSRDTAYRKVYPPLLLGLKHLPLKKRINLNIAVHPTATLSRLNYKWHANI